MGKVRLCFYTGFCPVNDPVLVGLDGDQAPGVTPPRRPPPEKPFDAEFDLSPLVGIPDLLAPSARERDAPPGLVSPVLEEAGQGAS